MFETALEFIKAGKFQKAQELLLEIIAKQPNDFDANHMLAVVCGELGDAARAEKHFNAAFAIDAKYPPLYQNWGLLLSKQNRFKEAIDKFGIAIRLAPNFPPVYSDRGNALSKLKRYGEAINDHNQAIKLAPNFFAFYSNRGNALVKQRKYAAALADYDRSIQLNPRYADAFNGRGNVLTELKRHDDAFAAYDKALSLKPDLAEAWLGRGKGFTELERYDDAFAAYDKALSIKSDLAEAWLGRGNVFSDLERYDEAFAAYDKALSINPDLAEAWLGRGNAFTELKRYDEAFAAYDKALSIEPDLPEVWLGRGNAFMKRERYDEASAAYDKALSAKPDLAEAWLGRGNVYNGRRRYPEAFAAYDKALSIKPRLVEAWLARGNLFTELKRYDEASAAYDKALSIAPDSAMAWLGRGNIFDRTKQPDKALSAYSRVRQIDADFEFIKGRCIHQKMLCCDWSGLGDLVKEIEADISAGKKSAEPFGWQGISDSERSLQLCAQIWSKSSYSQPDPLPAVKAERHSDKIRLGYVSGEFREQATSHLIVGLLENHDKSRFDLFAFDNGWDDGSAIRKRIDSATRQVVDIRGLDDSSAAKRIADEEIDILINLNGYFGEGRPRVFAYKSAPIQVNYLGFPGTLGANYIDYIIADETVIPLTSKAFYDEKVVYLPHTYQPNDRLRAISEAAKSRQESELPENGFVFCCFNNCYKITPDTFASWMNILLRVEHSVLWLLRGSEAATANLRHSAQQAGVDPSRLVFAKVAPPAEHLARHRLADLFLDTLPYNAHTTASDALWAGLPLLTQIGSTFAGRVAASLLEAMALPELITRSREEYEARAIELALNGERLQAIKEKLTGNRMTTPLFDTPLYTKHLEAAYEAMYRRHKAGLPPEDIDIHA